MYRLRPQNKYVWIEPITAENKIGSLYVVSHSQNSYLLGKIKAFSHCDETKDLKEGDLVLYDSIGAVGHRLGTQTLTTVKAVNILAVVENEPTADDLTATLTTLITNGGK